MKKWTKILLIIVIVIFLGILAGPCAVDAKNQKEKKNMAYF